MQTETKSVAKEFQTNDSLPLLYVDGVRINKRRDGVYFIRVIANLPEYFSEQVRLMVDDSHLHRIIDSLCKSTDYYPKKAKSIPKKSPKTVK